MDGPVTTTAIDRARLPDDVTRRPGRRHPGSSESSSTPATDGPWPGVLLLGGAEGGLHELDAALLAAHGFSVLALAYFGRTGYGSRRSSTCRWRCFGAAIELLLAQPEVRARSGGRRRWLPRWGGRAARRRDLPARRDRREHGRLGCRDGRHPARVRPAGHPAAADVGSWTWRGQRVAVPAVPRRSRPHRPGRRRAGRWSWREPSGRISPVAATSPAASIPVERIRGPVLLLSAEDDRSWPSADLSEVAAERLRRLRSPLPVPARPLPERGARHRATAVRADRVQSSLDRVSGSSWEAQCAGHQRGPRRCLAADHRVVRGAPARLSPGSMPSAGRIVVANSAWICAVVHRTREHRVVPCRVPGTR